MGKLVYKAYKVRIYPNKEQREFFAINFGCCRFLYNAMLSERIEVYEKFKDNKEALKSYKYMTEKQYKEKYEFLKKADARALVRERMALYQAYRNFFNKTHKYPKFKKKHDNQSYTTYQRVKVDLDKKIIKLPKTTWVKFRDDRKFDVNKIAYITVSKTKTNKYFASIVVQENIEELEKKGNKIGIDLGLKDFITTSNNERYNFDKKKVKIYQRRIDKLQKALSRKKKDSKNREKARLQLAKEYEKLTNYKKDFYHKLSHKLITENQIINAEDLNIEDMLKKHYLARQIATASWYTFLTFLEYKANWYGREFNKIDKYFPSSKLCSSCGYKNDSLKLSDREWFCPSCNTKHDRDLNAAINIRDCV